MCLDHFILTYSNIPLDDDDVDEDGSRWTCLAPILLSPLTISAGAVVGLDDPC